MATIHVPDVPRPTERLCWKQSKLMERCDRMAGHGGWHTFDLAAHASECVDELNEIRAVLDWVGAPQGEALHIVGRIQALSNRWAARFCEAHQVAAENETCPCCEAVHQHDRARAAEVTHSRVRELARNMARDDHTRAISGYLDRGDYSEGHEHNFERCPHPDCVLVQASNGA